MWWLFRLFLSKNKQYFPSYRFEVFEEMKHNFDLFGKNPFPKFLAFGTASNLHYPLFHFSTSPKTLPTTPEKTAPSAKKWGQPQLKSVSVCAVECLRLGKICLVLFRDGLIVAGLIDLSKKKMDFSVRDGAGYILSKDGPKLYFSLFFRFWDLAPCRRTTDRAEKHKQLQHLWFKTTTTAKCLSKTIWELLTTKRGSKKLHTTGGGSSPWEKNNRVMSRTRQNYDTSKPKHPKLKDRLNPNLQTKTQKRKSSKQNKNNQ